MAVLATEYVTRRVPMTKRAKAWREKLKRTQSRPHTSNANHLLALNVVPSAYEKISDRPMMMLFDQRQPARWLVTPTIHRYPASLRIQELATWSEVSVAVEDIRPSHDGATSGNPRIQEL